MSWWLIWEAMIKKGRTPAIRGFKSWDEYLESLYISTPSLQHFKTLTEGVHVQWGGNVSHGVWCCLWHFGTWRTTPRFKPRFFHVPPALSPTCADQGRDAIMQHLALIILLWLLTLITHSTALSVEQRTFSCVFWMLCSVHVDHDLQWLSYRITISINLP